ncbi:N-acetylmuramoyl-L-alanine amidase [Stenotrophomonas sp. SAU14A_NAIMI4_8]|uniref:N-acetylmuramoyl-L-alanine amidase family protein n=1 Tax=Stenotrophomonas sp. SAU14A_NAIMI4_8 TaxID=2072409 RepID=UPI000D540C07|nr:N-acetylmuramoyl-L-alanine amidase [Stenotrophomonas sp. SAU14A_NAIMI4_8]AWH31631.1 N-acetylmuramoyl-L-alanine amidase [Stenotrophomonas sp. SAU14A_NAIMI4_8]
MMYIAHSRNSVLIAAGLALSLAFAGSASSQQPQKQEGKDLLSVAESATIFRQLEPELQRFVDKQSRLPGQEKSVIVRITPDNSTGIVWIDLDSGYLPKGQTEFSEEFGDKLAEIESELYDYLSGTVGFKYVIARIGGRTINEVFPPERLLKRKNQRSSRSAASPVPGMVLINPGHGKYFHHGENVWKYERPTPYAGTTNVHEDDITPQYASVLDTYLTSRSNMYVTDVRHTRDILMPFIEPESNLPWKDLAARYYIKSLLPNDGGTIWNLYPNGKPGNENLREYDEDVMARAKYANHINAETLISLHTNAAGPSARGTLVMTQLDDPSSVQLSNNILCYMKEQINAVEAYSDFAIRPALVNGNNKAEVRDAEMPTALIEVAFHSNTEDAAALQDPKFRSAAMKGVEKGYRTFMRGETDCRPLTITSVPAVTGPHLTEIPYSVQFVGSPTYPLYLRSKVVTCPPGYLCSQNSTQYAFPGDTPGTLNAVAKCTVARPVAGSVIVLDRYLEDSDGVKSPMVRTSITCV